MDDIDSIRDGDDDRDEPGQIDQPDDDRGDETGRGLPNRWRGIIAPLDTPSGDRRVLATPKSGVLRARPLPWPLMYQLASADGHDNSVIAGDTDRVWREGGYLMGEGRFDLGSPYGQEAARQLAEGFHRWVSIFVDDQSEEAMCQQSDGSFASCDEECQHGDRYGVTTDWRGCSVTMVAEQAFPEATIKPVWEDDEQSTDEVPVEELIAAGISTGISAGITAEQRDKATKDGAAMPGGRYPIRNESDLANAIRAVGRAGGPEGTEADRDAVRRHIISRAKTLGHTDMIPDTWNSDGTLKSGSHALGDGLIEDDGECGCQPRAVLASGGQVLPADWFANPRLTGATPLTVTEDGRVFGHLACWDTCHTGYAGRCVVPPKSSSGYAYFHTASIATTDGALPVGLITLGTGHAELNVGYSSAVAHYDNTGTQAAAVRAGEDAHGIWLAGAVLPGVATDRREVLARSPISGDWRVIGGREELVAALSVNVPGFPVPRFRADADGRPYALVAAGVLPRPGVDVHADGALGERMVTRIADAVASTLERRDQARREQADRVGQWAQLMGVHGAERARKQRAQLALVMDAHRRDVQLGGTFNWVEDRGGLPPYIKRVAKHIGGSESESIAAAINFAKHVCSTGDVKNWPGVQNVNAGSRAEACAAVAAWEALKNG